MERTYCTNDYSKLSENFYNNLSKEGSKYTIDEAIKELGLFVQGYKKNEKHHNYWINFKPFENPKPGPQSLANNIHEHEVVQPEKSIYVKGMETQKSSLLLLKMQLLSSFPIFLKRNVIRLLRKSILVNLK